MAGVIYQLKDYEEDVSLEAPSGRTIWRVTGTEDENEVKALADGAIPGLLGSGDEGLILKAYALHHDGAGVWTVTARYGDLPVNFSLDTSGGTTKFLQSLETVDSAAVDPEGNPSIPPDYGGAIGVTETNVEGVDVQTPVFQFSLTIKHNWYDLPPDYLQTLKLLTGTTNDSPVTFTVKNQVLDFDAGECLFQGAIARETGSENIEITYKFASQENRYDFSSSGGPDNRVKVGGFTGPDGNVTGQMMLKKGGWDYIWARYMIVSQAWRGAVLRIDVEDGGANYTVPPSVAITSADGNGTGAAAHAVLSASVSNLTLVAGGGGYTDPPRIVFTGGNGTGATATCNITGGAISNLTLVSGGAGYTDPPGVFFAGGNGAFAFASSSIAGEVGSVVLDARGSNYTVPPNVTFNNAGTGGTGANATAVLASNTSSAIKRPVAAYSERVYEPGDWGNLTLYF